MAEQNNAARSFFETSVGPSKREGAEWFQAEVYQKMSSVVLYKTGRSSWTRRLMRRSNIKIELLGSYLERVDELAQQVGDAFFAEPEGDSELSWLLNKSIHYRMVRDIVAQRRAFDNLRKGDEAELQNERIRFVLAYKLFCDRRASKLN